MNNYCSLRVPDEANRIASEMEALSEIYIDCFKSLSDGDQFKCQINLFPSNNKVPLPICYIKLRVTFIGDYPLTIPIIDIYKTYNLSKGELATIDEIIKATAKECSEKNIEMIHAVCEQILIIINKKAQANEPIDSLNSSGFSNSPRFDIEKVDNNNQLKLSVKEAEKQSDIVQEESSSKSHEFQRRIIESSNNNSDLSLAKIASTQLYNHTYSRFNSDFTVISKLGQGGGGSVFKVQNVWDKMFYAIKRIKITIPQFENLNSALNTVRSEGYVLSIMQHPCIVRYYQTWVEEYNEEDYADEVTEEDEYEYKSTNEKQGSCPRKDKNTLFRKFSYEQSSNNIINKEMPTLKDDDDESNVNNNEDSYSDCLVMFEEDNNANGKDKSIENGSSNRHNNIWDDDDEENFEDQDKSKEKTQSAFNSTINKPSPIPTRSKLKTLYIQMEFCEGKTLREAIDNQSLSEEQKWKMVVQLLEAVNYIHAKTIIHRDIKPGNIFLDSQFSVKLGDFGLAKLIKTKSHLEELPKFECIKYNDNDLMTYAIGTKYYCSPEQEKAKNYNYKTDMFSIGIIIFEMFYSFGSFMERDIVLRDIKEKNVFPSHFIETSGEHLIEIVEKLTKINPNLRPKAKELLNSNLIPKFSNKKEVMESLSKIMEENKDYYAQFIDQIFRQKIEDKLAMNSSINTNDMTCVDSYDHYHSILLNSKRNNTSTNFLFHLIEKTLNQIRRIFHESNAFYWRLNDVQAFDQYYHMYDCENKKVTKIKKSKTEIEKEHLMLTQNGNIVVPLNNFSHEISIVIDQILRDKTVPDLLPCKIYSDTLTSSRFSEGKRTECYDLIYLSLWNDIAHCGKILTDYDEKYIIDTLIVLFDVLEKLKFGNEILIRINSSKILEVMLNKIFGRKEEMNESKLDLLQKLAQMLNNRDNVPHPKNLNKIARKKNIKLPLSTDKSLELNSWLEINGELEALKLKFKKHDLENEINSIASLFQDRQYYWKRKLPSNKSKIKIDFAFIPNNCFIFSGIFIQVVYINEKLHEQIPIAECGQLENQPQTSQVSHGFVLRFFIENIVKIKESKIKELEDYGNYKLDILLITTSETIEVLPSIIEIERQIIKEKYRYDIIFRKQERTSFKEYFSHYRMKCLIIVSGKDKTTVSYDIKTREANKTLEHIDFGDLAYLITCFSRKKSK